MTELYPSDAVLNALSGAADPEQEVLFIPTGQSPYYTSFYKMLHRLLAVARRAGDLRVFKDGDLTFGVRAGTFMDGPTARAFPGAAAQPLADNAVNSIYLAAAGDLTVNSSGFPSPAACPHIPLATIAAGTASAAGQAGAYDFADIVDLRGRALFTVPSALTPALANQAAALFDGPATQTVSAGGFCLAHGNKPVLLVTVSGGQAWTSSPTEAVADGLTPGQLLKVVLVSDAAGAIVIKDGAHTLLAGDCRRNRLGEWIELVWDGSRWVELSRSDAIPATTRASGAYSHAEGDGSVADGVESHAEGSMTAASGIASHAQGLGSAAAGLASHAAGVCSQAKLAAQCAHAAGQFAALGDAQYTRTIVRRATTAAAPAELTLDGNQGGADNRLFIDDEHTLALRILIAARQDSGAHSALYHRQCVVQRTGGTVSLVGTVQTVGTDIASDGDWTVAIATDNSSSQGQPPGKCVTVTVTGKAATNIRWVALVEAVEIEYAD